MVNAARAEADENGTASPKWAVGSEACADQDAGQALEESALKSPYSRLGGEREEEGFVVQDKEKLLRLETGRGPMDLGLPEHGLSSVRRVDHQHLYAEGNHHESQYLRHGV